MDAWDGYCRTPQESGGRRLEEKAKRPTSVGAAVWRRQLPYSLESFAADVTAVELALDELAHQTIPTPKPTNGVCGLK